MLEKAIERYFCEAVARRGGVAEKVTSLSARGYFDRVAVMPGGRVIFAEIKKPKGGVVAAHQRTRHAVYRALGAEVVVIKTYADVDRLMNGGVEKTGTRSQQSTT